MAARAARPVQRRGSDAVWPGGGLAVALLQCPAAPLPVPAGYSLFLGKQQGSLMSPEPHCELSPLSNTRWKRPMAKEKTVAAKPDVDFLGRLIT